MAPNMDWCCNQIFAPSMSMHHRNTWAMHWDNFLLRHPFSPWWLNLIEQIIYKTVVHKTGTILLQQFSLCTYVCKKIESYQNFDTNHYFKIPWLEKHLPIFADFQKLYKPWLWCATVINTLPLFHLKCLLLTFTIIPRLFLLLDQKSKFSFPRPVPNSLYRTLLLEKKFSRLFLTSGNHVQHMSMFNRNIQAIGT